MSAPPYLILGSTGQVGRALRHALEARGVPPAQLLSLDRRQAPLDRPDACVAAIDRARPRAVFNAAAYTQVDLAETETEKARLINAETPGALARACAARDIPLVHYSTDYVFDGSGSTPWKEQDPTAPLNTYGLTKLEGEQAIRAAGGRHLIFRTSWVYAAEGKNFLNTMLRLGSDREQLKVVADQYGAPTFAGHLAQATLQALDLALAMPSFPSGIYHLCNSGETTWHGFAEAIFAQARKRGIALKIREVAPIPSSAYPTPARRPENSRLDLSMLRRVFEITPPNWSDGLEACMDELYERPEL